jgi:hypothetical protein
MLTGLITGAVPWLFYAFHNGFSSLLMELSGSAIVNAEPLSFLAKFGQHLVNLILLGVTVVIGARPPWNVDWILLPLIPLILFFWLGALVYGWRTIRNDETYRFNKVVMGCVGTVLIITFLVTPFGADPSGRYFVPLIFPLSFFAAEFLLWINRKYGLWAWALLIFVVSYNFYGILRSANSYPPGITTQFDPITQIDHRYDYLLLQFLESKEEYYGYTNYWVSYPLAFLSDEKIVFIPRLPYHLDMRYTTRDDRYEPYDDIVHHANRVAYITTFHEPLDGLLRERFTLFGLQWKEKKIGDYQIFYNLTKKVTPYELGITDYYK